MKAAMRITAAQPVTLMNFKALKLKLPTTSRKIFTLRCFPQTITDGFNYFQRVLQLKLSKLCNNFSN